MTFSSAIKHLRDGAIVTNVLFGDGVSIHSYDGRLYFEEGQIVTESQLAMEPISESGEWLIVVPKEKVDRSLMGTMHQEFPEGLTGGVNYNLCVK